MLAPALGLDLITPPLLSQAISEGTDVSAADKETIDQQIETTPIKIYVYNSQNVTPDVQAQLHGGEGCAHSLRHHHRDAGTRQCDLPGVADPPAAGYRGGAGRGAWLTTGSGKWRRPPGRIRRPSDAGPDLPDGPAVRFDDAAVRWTAGWSGRT